ncbi:hypothetical protein TIFTF001_043062 [Ficus carica]|uniref:Retrotransposon gag domain-containing protein n=1 Tax=Ficus carica TaxID=3494 RepID=A0AA87YQC4_FICCA|nr:hypothetical protein TIFTF001_043062 [Ficus carica]
MSWQDFVTEFRTMYYNREVLAVQQDEFTNLKQRSMTVMEAIKKFEKLARLCPELVPNETEKVKRMMKMFWTDISKQVSAGSSPPTLVSDCVSRAIRAECWINQDKETRARIFKARREEKAMVKQTQPRQISEAFPKGQNSNPAQSSKQFGRNKLKGNFTGQGQQKNYLRRGIIEEMRISITTYDIIALFDSGATHSFISLEFAQKLGIDLIVSKLQDFDVILGMDSLGNYDAKID